VKACVCITKLIASAALKASRFTQILAAILAGAFAASVFNVVSFVAKASRRIYKIHRFSYEGKNDRLVQNPFYILAGAFAKHHIRPAISQKNLTKNSSRPRGIRRYRAIINLRAAWRLN
jgi:hypothetical protein